MTNIDLVYETQERVCYERGLNVLYPNFQELFCSVLNKNIFKLIKFHQKVISRRWLFFQKSDGQVIFIFILLICFHKFPQCGMQKKQKYFKTN